MTHFYHFRFFKRYISTILENFASVKINGHWKPRFWHSDSSAEIFPRGKDLRVSFCVLYKSRSRSREIAEKLPWRAFNPSFWAEPSVARGCKKQRWLVLKICGWGIIAWYSLAPNRWNPPIYSDMCVCVCVTAAIKSLLAIARIYFDRFYDREKTAIREGGSNGALAHRSVKSAR